MAELQWILISKSFQELQISTGKLPALLVTPSNESRLYLLSKFSQSQEHVEFFDASIHLNHKQQGLTALHEIASTWVEGRFSETSMMEPVNNNVRRFLMCTCVVELVQEVSMNPSPTWWFDEKPQIYWKKFEKYSESELV